jgi:hypothetical protein
MNKNRKSPPLKPQEVQAAIDNANEPQEPMIPRRRGGSGRRRKDVSRKAKTHVMRGVVARALGIVYYNII